MEKGKGTKIITISMTEEDLKEIDLYCMAHNLTRSKFMVQSAVQALEVEKVCNATMRLNKLLLEYSKKGYLEKDDLKALDAIKLLYEKAVRMG